LQLLFLCECEYHFIGDGQVHIEHPFGDLCFVEEVAEVKASLENAICLHLHDLAILLLGAANVLMVDVLHVLAILIQ
jgi:hypothetical protein